MPKWINPLFVFQVQAGHYTAQKYFLVDTLLYVVIRAETAGLGSWYCVNPMVNRVHPLMIK